jgi:hypothetical protein
VEVSRPIELAGQPQDRLDVGMWVRVDVRHAADRVGAKPQRLADEPLRGGQAPDPIPGEGDDPEPDRIPDVLLELEHQAVP